MELESLVLAAVPEDTSTLDRDWLSGFDHIKRMSDVNAVGDPSGQGALGQLLKGFARDDETFAVMDISGQHVISVLVRTAR